MHGANDPGRYGASFAEVYDDWYPGGDEHHVVAHVARYLDPGSRVLELGVGTGRLALRMVEAGFEVVGLDGSPEMFAALAGKDPGDTVAQVLADAGDPSGWASAGISGTFDCVIAACNLLLNLASPQDQRACVTGAARLLTPGDVLVVELQQIHRGEAPGACFAMSSASGDAPVVIATETDPGSGTIEGEHIELRDDGSALVRPWSVCPVTLSDLDRWCGESGLELSSRHADWSGAQWYADSPGSVSTYHRSAERPPAGTVS